MTVRPTAHSATPMIQVDGVTSPRECVLSTVRIAWCPRVRAVPAPGLARTLGLAGPWVLPVLAF